MPGQGLDAAVESLRTSSVPATMEPSATAGQCGVPSGRWVESLDDCLPGEVAIPYEYTRSCGDETTEHEVFACGEPAETDCAGECALRFVAGATTGDDGCEYSSERWPTAACVPNDAHYGLQWAPQAADTPQAIHYVTDLATFQDALAAVAPGDAIVVAHGTHDWGPVAWPAHAAGTADAPVVFAAEEPGATVFSGQTRFTVHADHVLIGGFDFVDTIRGVIEMQGDHARIAGNRFVRVGSQANSAPDGAIRQYGDFGEIDNNIFEDAYSVSIAIAEPAQNPAKQPHVHHNEFRDISTRWDGGHGEAMMIGYAHEPLGPNDDDEIEALVEHNLFTRANGDQELISIKSSKNIIRNNCMLSNRGAGLVVRLGHNNLITGNWMHDFGRAGVRISGTGNHVLFNYVDLVRDWNGAAVSLHHHQVNADGQFPYVAASGNRIEHNVFGDYNYTAEAMPNATTPTAPPTDNVIADNRFFAAEHLGYRDRTQILPEASFSEANDWQNNTHSTTLLTNDEQCGVPGVFQSEVLVAPALMGLLHDPTEISAPSWW